MPASSSLRAQSRRRGVGVVGLLVRARLAELVEVAAGDTVEAAASCP
jgi:hypothetical protein